MTKMWDMLFGRRKRRAKTSKNKSGYPKFSDSDKLCHRAVKEKELGRKIPRGMEVHHKDGDKTNFRRENLELIERGEHRRLHNYKRRVKKTIWG